MASLRAFASHRVLSGLLGVGLMLATARWMPVSEFADYVLLQSVAGVTSIIAGLGLDRVLYRWIPAAQLAGERRYILKLAAVAFGSRLVLGVLVAALALQLSMPQERSAQAADFALAIAFASVLGTSELLTVASNALMAYVWQARITALTLGVRLLSLSALVGFGITLDSTLVLTVLIVTELGLCALLALLCIRPALRALSPASGGDAALAGPATLARQATANYASYWAGLPWQGSVLRLVVASFASTTELALFGFLQTLADRLRQYLPLQLLQSAVEPLLVRRRAAGDAPAQLNAGLDILRALNFCVLTGAALGCLVAGDVVVAALTAGKYREAGVLGACVLFALATASLGGVLWISCNIHDAMGALVRHCAPCTLLLLPLLWLAARHGGALGVAAVSALPMPLLWASMRWRKHPAASGLFNWRRDAAAITAALAGWGCVALRSNLLPGGGAWLDLPLALAVYGGLVFALRAVSTQDIRVLRFALRSRGDSK